MENSEILVFETHKQVAVPTFAEYPPNDFLQLSIYQDIVFVDHDLIIQEQAILNTLSGPTYALYLVVSQLAMDLLKGF